MSTPDQHAETSTWSPILIRAQQDLLDATSTLAAARERRAAAIAAALEDGCDPGEIARLLRLTETMVNEIVRNREIHAEHEARLGVRPSHRVLR